MNSFDWGCLNEGYGGHKLAITTETFDNDMYERFFQVEEGDIVLDIGSSVGPFVYSILGRNPKHVFCIEPSEKEFKTLVKNTTGYPVTHILKGISDKNSYVNTNQLFGGEEQMEGITFKKLCHLYNLEKIDFLKTDCEGGEYDIFTLDNYDFIKNNIKKIVGEWHLSDQYNSEVELSKKFRIFRDTFLSKFTNYRVFSTDGVDIQWDLWNEHFIEYYSEVIIYIDNR